MIVIFILTMVIIIITIIISELKSGKGRLEQRATVFAQAWGTAEHGVHTPRGLSPKGAPNTPSARHWSADSLRSVQGLTKRPADSLRTPSGQTTLVT